MNLYDIVNPMTVDEAKATSQRLDPKCWKGKHKEGTKVKGGVRVNNCVPNEDVEEGVISGTQRVPAEAEIKKIIWDTLRINEPTAKESFEAAVTMLSKRPQTRMVQQLMGHLKALSDRARLPLDPFIRSVLNHYNESVEEDSWYAGDGGEWGQGDAWSGEQHEMVEARLTAGDPIIVTAPNEFEGRTGEIAEFSPSGKFVIVNLYNYGKHSMHLSDVEYNKYADEEDEVDEGYASTIGLNPTALDPASKWKLNVRQMIADYIKNPQGLYNLAKQKGPTSVEAMAYQYLMHPTGKIPLPPNQQGVAESFGDSPVAGAITRRILSQRHDLLKQYGPELVGAAVDNIADYVGDVEEIGSSDVSGWVAQVERMLKENPPEAFSEGFQDFNKVEPYAVAMKEGTQSEEWTVSINGKPWNKTFSSKAQADKAAKTIEKKYGKKTKVTGATIEASQAYNDGRADKWYHRQPRNNFEKGTKDYQDYIDGYSGKSFSKPGVTEAVPTIRGTPKAKSGADYTGEDLVRDANKLFTAGGFKLVDKEVEPRVDNPKKINTTYYWRKKIKGLTPDQGQVQGLMIEIYNYAPKRTYWAINDWANDGAQVTPDLAQKLWRRMEKTIKDSIDTAEQENYWYSMIGNGKVPKGLEEAGVAEAEDRVDPILIKALNRMPDGLASHGEILNACYDAYAMELGRMEMKSNYGTTHAYIPQLMTLYKDKHGLDIKEAGNPAQQAAIAIAMKKAGKKPKSVDEGVGKQLSVEQLATISDAALDSAYGYGRSQPGNTFGWQANLKSAAFAKQMIDRGVTDIEQISNAIHKGWNVTAQAFVKNPQMFDDSKTMAPEKLQAKIAQRQKLMTQNYAQLPEDEKEKDRVVARAMLQAITGQQQSKFDQYQQQRNTPAKNSAEYINRQANAKPGDPVPPPFQKGVTEDTGSWIVYDPETKQIKKRFKTHTAGKSYARTHGLGFASSEFYFDRIKEKEAVAEFAPSPERDDNDKVPDQILKLANRWWNAGDKQPQITNVLRSLGWSIAQVESDEDAVQMQHDDGTTYFISADDFDPEVFEAQTDYQKRRQRERDVDAGKPVSRQPKNPQTDYARKRAQQKKEMELGESYWTRLQGERNTKAAKLVAELEETIKDIK